MEAMEGRSERKRTIFSVVMVDFKRKETIGSWIWGGFKLKTSGKSLYDMDVSNKRIATNSLTEVKFETRQDYRIITAVELSLLTYMKQFFYLARLFDDLVQYV